MKRLTTCCIAFGVTFTAFAVSLFAYSFGSVPLDDAKNAANSINKECRRRAPSPKQLIAYMLAPTWWETTYQIPSVASTQSPSPMTLSRGDSGDKLFPPGQSSPGARYHRVFWHTGIGAWQLDDYGLGTRMGPEKFDAQSSANRVAEAIWDAHCDGRNVFDPWVACRKRGSCVQTSNEIRGRIEELVKRDPTVERAGGAEPRACRIAGWPSTFPCLYIDPSKAQGFTGWTQGPNAALPLALPFYVLTLEEGKQEYEVRYWLAEKAGIDRDFQATRSYGVRAKDGLEWIDNPRTLCDVTEQLGSCGEQSGLSQFRSDGTTAIPAGGVSDESTVKFKGFVSDPRGQQVRLEIELRRLSEYGGGFTGESTQASALGTSGRVAEIVAYGLINGQYHWRARAVNAAGARSPWLSFGGNSDSANDVTVSVGGACSPSVVFAEGVLKATSCNGQAQIFDQSALNIGETSASLKADINPNGNTTAAFFEYGISVASLRNTPSQAVGSDSVIREVRQFVTGLTCDTTFQFRTVATNAAGKTEGTFQTFMTTACPPVGAPPQVTTQPAIEFGPTSANLKASINPNGNSTDAFFEYGVTSSLFTSTGAEQIGSATVILGFSQFLTGLTCDTLYYYRAVAANAFGRQDGAFLTFKTTPCLEHNCYLLSLLRDPVEGGDSPLASPVSSADCPPGRYHPSEQIAVTATPASGWSVRGWTGTLDDASTSLTNTISMPPLDYVARVYYRPPCERSFAAPSGDVWKKGELHTIKWFWGGCGETVRVELLKGGDFYDTIAILPATVESYTWTPSLSYANASNYQIKVVHASDPSILTLTHFFTLIDP